MQWRIELFYKRPEYSALLSWELLWLRLWRQRAEPREKRLVAGGPGPSSQPPPVWQRTREHPEKGWTQVGLVAHSFNRWSLCYVTSIWHWELAQLVVLFSFCSLETDIPQGMLAAVWGRLSPRGRSLPAMIKLWIKRLPYVITSISILG